eukprot:CAMPEP_0115365226 /NCGR_PEP_ID=MMETSP0270-20121206/104174_1 /TAXON_ID=71861 /ORGANISM="Scrippsiella trochoidea, Strain CCMP3099" /LENGTH=49 /DNA_ID= /DNA_START= /DNA_END= /DNA_ORIENTATION=
MALPTFAAYTVPDGASRAAFPELLRHAASKVQGSDPPGLRDCDADIVDP